MGGIGIGLLSGVPCSLVFLWKYLCVSTFAKSTCCSLKVIKKCMLLCCLRCIMKFEVDRSPNAAEI